MEIEYESSEVGERGKELRHFGLSSDLRKFRLFTLNCLLLLSFSVDPISRSEETGRGEKEA